MFTIPRRAKSLDTRHPTRRLEGPFGTNSAIQNLQIQLAREVEVSEKSLKVTDRRMFTADGSLRDDYRYLEESPPPVAVAEEPEEVVAEPEAPAAPEKKDVPELRQAAGYASEDGRKPQVMDLISMLAEPASLYLREAHAAQSGDLRAVSQAGQNLELARLHIDLLVVLREKTASNLESQELAMLDDIIYRLQMAFVQAQG